MLLTNFNDMIGSYDAFLKNCEWRISDIAKIKSLSRQLNETGIANTSHRAQREIEELLLGPNPNAKELKAMVSKTCRELSTRMDTLIRDAGLNHADRMPSYQSFFKALAGYRRFQGWFEGIEKLHVQPNLAKNSNLKRRPALTAVIAQVDWLFSERISVADKTETDIILPSFENVDGQMFVYRKIDSRDLDTLRQLVKKRKEKFLNSDPDHTEKLFFETEIERAIEYQSSFYKYKTETVHKRYHSALERWIDCLVSARDYPMYQEDNRYSTFESIETEKSKDEYKGILREIENNGYYVVKTDTNTSKIYTPELALILSSEALPTQNMDTGAETKIRGSEYLKIYMAAYRQGEEYFETEFKVSANTLYGEKAEHYVRDIHSNYFHVQHTPTIKGWEYVKKKYPFIITRKAIEEYGYYSGILNKVEDQIKKHPRLYAGFDKCEHDLPPEQNNTKVIDWVELFEEVDIEAENPVKAYRINTLKEKENYFSQASFNLTIQYLTQFKKQTFLLTDKRKLDYIIDLNLPRPQPARSDSSICNQTVYEAQCNYFDFVMTYKLLLGGKYEPVQLNPEVEIRPKLVSAFVKPFFEIIKDFFEQVQQQELLRILETGDQATEKLLFKDNGNRLTDAFKKLKENDLIIGCQKKDLISWILVNFDFFYRNQRRGFIYDSIEKVISRNGSPCKNPLIEIKDGLIRKA